MAWVNLFEDFKSRVNNQKKLCKFSWSFSVKSLFAQTEFNCKSSILVFFFSYFIKQSSKLGLGLYSILLSEILEIFLL